MTHVSAETRDRIVEAMREDPFIDDVGLMGTTQQDERMKHYADIALATLTAERDSALAEVGRLREVLVEYLSADEAWGDLVGHGVAVDPDEFKAGQLRWINARNAVREIGAALQEQPQ